MYRLPNCEPLMHPDDGAALVGAPVSGAAPVSTPPSDVAPGVLPGSTPEPAAQSTASESYSSPIDTAQIQREMQAYQLAELLNGLKTKVETLEAERTATTGKAPVKVDASADALPAEYANDPHMQRIFEVEKLARKATETMERMANERAEERRMQEQAAQAAAIAQRRSVESANVQNWVDKVLVPNDPVLSKNPHAVALVQGEVQNWLKYEFDPSQNLPGIRHQYGMLQMKLDHMLRNTIHPAFAQAPVREVVQAAQAAAQNNLSATPTGVAPKSGNVQTSRHKGNAKDFSDLFKSTAERLGVKVG